MKSGATVEGLEELLFLGFHWVRAGLGKEEVKPPPPALTVERNGRHLQSRPLREEVGKDRRTAGLMLQAHQQGSGKLVPSWEGKGGRFYGHNQILDSPRLQHELSTSRDPPPSESLAPPCL